ncbi:MAG: ATP-dependent Lhr-like helicase, partial [Myxococcota bacterium]
MIFPRLHPRLQAGIVHRLGWTTLRPVQDLAGEALLRGDNAVILAPTAGGKTEAAFFPVLSDLLTHPTDAIGAIYIAPIKALLNNQAERLAGYTEMVGLRRFVWHGDVTASAKKRFKREPAEVLMTTPESLEVMLISQKVPVGRLMADLRVVIIDEIHALAGQDRGGHLMAVIERLAALSGHDVQRIGLSATVGNPTPILDWLSGSSQRGRTVVDPPSLAGRKALRIILREEEADLAADAATLTRRGKSLIFCNSRSTTEAIAERIQGTETPVFVHHSSVSAAERQDAEAMFHTGESAAIVCTSTLELGIDVGDLDRVIQVSAPDTISSFLQRMGRTGRRPDTVANTTFLCPDTESVLQAMALIRLARRGFVESVRLDDRRWPILVHQLLAMALAKGGVSAEDAWSLLSRVPDLSGISRAEFDALINHMLAEDFLYATGGVLAMGEAAEKAYGRYNFMELYAVFSSPRRYTVATLGGRSLGSLDQDFVDRLELNS